MSSSSPFPSASFVGVVSEVKRSTINNFISTKCSVFGISEEEYEALKENFEVRPRQYEPSAERYVVHCNAWRAMRALGRFGYHFPVDNLGGLMDEAPTGERRIWIWTLIAVNE